MALRWRTPPRSRPRQALRASAPPGSAGAWGRPARERRGRLYARPQYLANSLNSSRDPKGLFRRDDECVVRLAPVRHFDGHAGTRRAKPLNSVLNAFLVDARTAVEREDLGVGQPARRVAEHRHLIIPVRHDPAVEERHRLALAHALAVDSRVADRARHLDPMGP